MRRVYRSVGMASGCNARAAAWLLGDATILRVTARSFYVLLQVIAWALDVVPGVLCSKSLNLCDFPRVATGGHERM